MVNLQQVTSDVLMILELWHDSTKKEPLLKEASEWQQVVMPADIQEINNTFIVQ